MIEHDPWIGDAYCSGIEGQRICIVGYSHHRNECDNDGKNFTRDVLKDITTGAQRYSFFTKVSQYFDADDPAEFWNRVLFFNFLPDCVGLDRDRYKSGTAEQLARGQHRFLRIIQGDPAHHPHPHKVFVFTRKGWKNCPPLEEEKPDGRPLPLDGFADYSWGTYRHNEHIVQAYGLQHPERAPGQRLGPAVRHIVSLPTERCC
jgi:hypothetical protein